MLYNGRDLQQGATCRFFDDLARKNYACTLPEYCAALLAATGNTFDYSCVGDLNGEFSISSQGYVCFDPAESNTTWIQAKKLVCYNTFDLTNYSKYFALQRTAEYDFVEGYNFNYVADAVLCADGGGAKQCSCIATIEGQQCNSCSVCDDGLANVEANAYIYDLDCTNIAKGITRSCDASFSWGDFFQLVEDIGVVPLMSPSQSPTSWIGSPTLDNPATNISNRDITPSNSSNKGLSSAAMGGTVGAVVGGGLAVIFAIVLVVVLRRRKKKNRGNDNNDPTIRGAHPSSNANKRATIPSAVPMANVILLDEASTALPKVKPSYKAQMRPY